MSNSPSHTDLPVFINKQGGSADRVIEVLKSVSNMTVHALAPEELYDAIETAVAEGLPRIVVAGGDGTLAMAAGLVAGSETEMAIIPGGTLNHFAKRHAISIKIEDALVLVQSGQAHEVPYGKVNDRLFLNTSSVGAYVIFVKTREKLEQKWSYAFASAFAALRRLIHFRRVSVHINQQPIKTPLLFIGVGERELQMPDMGQPKEGGEAGLHLIVLRCNTGLSALFIAIKAMFLGVDPLAKARDLDNTLLETIEVNLRGHRHIVTVALDGELVKLHAPLHYQFHQQGLKVVIPSGQV